MVLRDQRSKELPGTNPFNIKARTQLRYVGHEDRDSPLENHAHRAEEKSIYMGISSRESVQQDADWKTIGMDNLRLLQDARGHRSNVQTAGFDGTPTQRR